MQNQSTKTRKHTPFWRCFGQIRQPLRAWWKPAVLALLAAPAVPALAAAPAELKIDYAYYSPESLVIKRNGWLEQAFAPDHTPVRWVLSLGSNRALE